MLCIIQNDPEVPPGNILENLAVPYAVLHPYNGNPFPAVEDISALIVLGGAMGANDDQSHPFLSELKQLIRDVVGRKVPYLGICLGGQLLAAALGAKVSSNCWEELGIMSVSLTAEGMADRLFKNISNEFSTFQWHHDSFDIPEGGVLLATSPACPHQAFRVGESAWGFQFHPEVTEPIIRDWCAWDRSTQKKAEEIVAGFRVDAEGYQSTARRLMENFLNVTRVVR